MNTNWSAVMGALPMMVQAAQVATNPTTGQPLSGPDKAAAVISGIVNAVPDIVPQVEMVKLAINMLVGMYNTFHPLFMKTPAAPPAAVYVPPTAAPAAVFPSALAGLPGVPS